MKSIKKIAFVISLTLASAASFAQANKAVPQAIKCNPNRPSSKQCTTQDGRELTNLSIDSDVVEQGTYILSSASAGLYTYANAQNPAEIVQLSA